jgi:hypothetical protein
MVVTSATIIRSRVIPWEQSGRFQSWAVSIEYSDRKRVSYDVGTREAAEAEAARHPAGKVREQWPPDGYADDGASAAC